ncbi:MAG: methyltransferase domain-containing protein [Planctomycetes bacterium]|nr:methyltransferase domain-containing protein [Planctomycetota bacterium]
MEAARPDHASFRKPIRLHLGGHDVKEGWTLLNAQPRPGVDVVGNCTDLSMFADGSVEEVYASHIYEHLGFRRELSTALNEAARVLRTGGTLRVAVPNLEVLMSLFLEPGLDLDARFYVHMMIMGGQLDEYDFHKAGFSFQILGERLHAHGFRNIQQVESFGLFDDTSTRKFGTVPISLNVECTKG